MVTAWLVSQGLATKPGEMAPTVAAAATRLGISERGFHNWLAAGCHAVWVADPAAQTVTVHQAARPVEVFHMGDHVTGGDLLPGFTLAVSEVFA